MADAGGLLERSLVMAADPNRKVFGASGTVIKRSYCVVYPFLCAIYLLVSSIGFLNS